MANLIDLFVLNMYKAGLIYKSEDEMASVKTLNDECIITIGRRDASIWFTENSFKYICSLKFTNNLGIELLDVKINEIDITKFIDSVYRFLEMNLDDIITPMSSYTFALCKNSIDNFYLYIYENDMIRIKLEFNRDLLAKFIDVLYFICLIDIDTNNFNNTDL